MSDPVKNAEVEDVLSSIRRLVSEDKRPLQSPPAEVKAAPVVDRLVLTPALRVEQEPVVETVDAQMDVVETVSEDAAEVSEIADGSSAPVDGDAVTEQLDAEAQTLAEDYGDDPYNFDDAQDTDGETSSALLLTNPTTDVAETDAQTGDFEAETVAEEGAAIGMADTPEVAAEGADVQSEAPETIEVDAKTETLTAKIAALETAIGSISDQWEPDGDSDDDYAGSQAEAMVWEDDTPAVDDTPEVAFHHDLDDAKDVTEAVTPAGIEEAELDPAQEPMVERVTQASAQEFPEADDVDFETTADDAGPHGATDDIVADANAEDDLADEDIAGIALSSEDQMLDEDTLREMINEIVHTELQGALGARITRNVRRLVRREIHRALTARDLG